MSEFKAINELWAFVSSDEEGEGVLGAQLASGQWMPFIGADEARIKSLREIAVDIARAQGIDIKLVKFSHREEVELHSFSESNIVGDKKQ